MTELHVFYADKEHDSRAFDDLLEFNEYVREWVLKNPDTKYKCQTIPAKLTKPPPEESLKVWFVYSEDDFGGDEKIKIFYDKENAKKYQLEWIAKSAGKVDVAIDCRNVQSDYSLDSELIIKFMAMKLTS